MGSAFMKVVSITCVDLFDLNSFKDLFSVTINQYTAVLINLNIIGPKFIPLGTTRKSSH